MIIKTKYLGEMEIAEDKIIHFESGLPGFAQENKFVILDIPGNDILQIMQSIQTSHLAFIVTNPHYFYQDYHFKLDDHIIESLQITDEKDVVVLSIMTIEDPFQLSTINLQAPLLINSKNKRAKQFILPHDTYHVKSKISFPVSHERGV
ncbi:MAG TPA: flagellar assembly protein FliW [Pseudogracilibacillus sp.]|nr:flagellar assembly protein FliW [Pseudogracilibacillus sp.]